MPKKKLIGQRPLLNEFDGDGTGETEKRPRGMPPLSEIKSEIARLGLPESDSLHLNDTWLVSGFRTKAGQPIKNWRAAVRIWFREGYFPSQKKNPIKLQPVGWKPPTLEAIVAEVYQLLPSTFRSMPTAATRRAEKMGRWCFDRWTGSKWRHFGVSIDSDEQWKCLLPQMMEEFDRLNR
jgi:hypothetical protein